jgi:hypothetical protein
MSKEGLTIYEAQEKRISFIEKVVKEGVLEGISGSVNERNQNIALVYNLNREITGKEIAEIFPKSSGGPSSKQNIGRINKSFLKKAWEYASPQLQASYPLRELLMRKPIALCEVNARIKESLSERGANTNYIRNIEGAKALSNARRTLGKRGIEIPTMPKIIKYEDLRAKVEAENDNGKLQEILNTLNRYSLREYAGYRKENKEEILMKLTPILKKAGFYSHKKTEVFVKKLEEIGIPIRGFNASNGKSKYKRIYWVTFSKCKQRIIDALKNDPDLQRFKKNPVRTICGNPDRIPTTTNFIYHPDGYASNVTGMIKEITGIAVSEKGHVTLNNFLIGCSVPVFEYKHSHLYPTARTEELKAFIRLKREKV